MTIIQSHLINAIAEYNGFTKKKSTETIESIHKIIKSTLASGEDILISEFDKFCVKEKRERRGRNPPVQVAKINGIGISTKIKMSNSSQEVSQ